MAPRSVFAALPWLVSGALVVPWLAASEIGTLPSSSDVGCQRSCGGLDIPFPFGMGPDYCMMPGFQITCSDDTAGNGGAGKAFLGTTITTNSVEVLYISLPQGQATVLHPVSSYCYNANTGGMIASSWQWDLKDSPFTFSDTANKFTVVGCRTLAYIGDTRNFSAMYQTGCVSVCFQGSMILNPCSGIGCCQTAIPRGLQYYNVWFDERLNMSGIKDDGGGNGPCSYAVLMDGSNFSISTSSNATSSEFNIRNSGKAPVVLEWAIGREGCDTARMKPDEYACVSSNSACHDAASGRGYICSCTKGFELRATLTFLTAAKVNLPAPSGRGYICNCTKGFEGNPYVPNGCRDINECLDHDNCNGVCTNTKGSFTCVCPPGTRGNATIRDCNKDPFPPGARAATVILVIVLVALIAFLATQVYHHKESIKRKWYFEQNGGLMLSRILETDGNVAFTLYEREHIVKATRGFHKDNIVGEGAHGTVYKAILGAGDTATTVAVKRCKQIDESRKMEFVQELVVLCRVSHPNIVRLLGCCLHFVAPMLVYEFVPNGTLNDLLHGTPRRRVTLATRLRVAAEAAEALAHLHSPPHPTLHGDIKPQNILLDHGWVAKVSDFGCSTIDDNIQVVPKGTLAYLDPEFLQNFQITDKSDVFSFGVVLIELLTGKNPQAKEWKNLTIMFQNCMANGTLGNLLDADIVEEGTMGLINSAAQLVSRCIAAPGTARPAMGEVAEELRRFSDQMPERYEALQALEIEGHGYSYTATEGETSGFNNPAALSTAELAR